MTYVIYFWIQKIKKFGLLLMEKIRDQGGHGAVVRQ